jgi:hypothetical protein
MPILFDTKYGLFAAVHLPKTLPLNVVCALNMPEKHRIILKIENLMIIV